MTRAKKTLTCIGMPRGIRELSLRRAAAMPSRGSREIAASVSCTNVNQMTFLSMPE